MSQGCGIATAALVGGAVVGGVREPWRLVGEAVGAAVLPVDLPSESGNSGESREVNSQQEEGWAVDEMEQARSCSLGTGERGLFRRRGCHHDGRPTRPANTTCRQGLPHGLRH